ncbi:hypothetical protein [Hyalangium versicolor]|uniref:hypothetical protein n=1 Tax=Hyalangium versicolor TaxID=2861190 RepID=UPI001CCBE682|nr:hypothetical protein [Hyalangium versicolor]
MVSNSWQRRWAALGCLLGLLVFPGCDKGPEQLAKAEARYSDLIQRGVPPTDPAWDEVIAAFEAIPRDSKAWAEADRRLAAVRGLRSPLPPRPLATPGEIGEGREEVVTQRAECEKLARELGRATEARREQVRKSLDACREKLVRLEATSHPAGEGGDEHGPGDAGP